MKNKILKSLLLLLFIAISFGVVTQPRVKADVSACPVLAPQNDSAGNCYENGDDYSTCTVINKEVPKNPKATNINQSDSLGNGCVKYFNDNFTYNKKTNPCSHPTDSNVCETEVATQLSNNLEAYISYGYKYQIDGATHIQNFLKANKVGSSTYYYTVVDYSYSENTSEAPNGVFEGPYPDSAHSFSLVITTGTPYVSGQTKNLVMAIKLDCGNLVAYPGKLASNFKVDYSGYIYYKDAISKQFGAIPDVQKLIVVEANKNSEYPKITGGKYQFSFVYGTFFNIVTVVKSFKIGGYTYSDPVITPNSMTGDSWKYNSQIPLPPAVCSSSQNLINYLGQRAGNPDNADICDYGITLAIKPNAVNEFLSSGYNIMYTRTVSPTSTSSYSFNCSASRQFQSGSVNNNQSLPINTYITGTANPTTTPPPSGGTYSLTIVKGGVTLSGYPKSLTYTQTGTASPYLYFAAGPAVTFNGVGSVYSISWSFTSSQGSKTCSANITVIAPGSTPYLQVFGGDVMAGSGFTSESSCVANSSAGIYSNSNNQNGSSYVGSGTDQGAFAEAFVSGFSSEGNTGSGGPPNNLTFSNSPTNGNFGEAYCVPDYFSDFNNLSSTPTQVIDKLTTTTPSSQRNLRSWLPTNTLSLGKGYIILVKGVDFNIDENTAFQSNIPASSALSSLPYLYVIDEGGNIIISPSVTHLAGVFIDEPTPTTAVKNNSSSGNIFDCSTSSSFDPSPFTDSCSNTKLVVDGSFIAGNIDFQRTNTTTTVPEPSGSCKAASVADAEEFCYSPLIWLANPFSSSSSVHTDYLSSVPPTL